MPAIDKFLINMIKFKASDLHMSVGAPPICRVQGDMLKLKFPPLTQETNRALIYEIMTEGQRKKFEEKLDLDFSYAINGVGRFRVNIFMQHRGIAAVFRLIPTRIATCEELLIPQSVQTFTTYNQGLVIVAGPTGSGKSTTLAALIDKINQNYRKHIITIEDPIEFIHENKNSLINQRGIKEHTESFASALRSALREDPDVILVGEMRDLETMTLAITAAETGHLVFATLHTGSSSKTIDRIIDVFPKNQQEQIRTVLSESLAGVVCQQLIKRADGQGRIAAFEVLIVTNAVSNLIREGKTFQIPSVLQTARGSGMQSMDMNIIELIKAKKITPEEGFSHAINKKTILPYLQGEIPSDVDLDSFQPVSKNQ